MSKKTFSELLAEFRDSQTKTHGLGVECAQMAYEAFQEHGNLTYATHFWNALKTNGDKNGFMMWLTDFAPAKMVDGKFLKDKEKEAALGDKAWRKGEAFARSFYLYKQVKLEDKSFGADQIVDQVRRIVKRFQAEGMTPDDAAAAQALEELDNVVTMFSAKVDVIQENHLKSLDEEGSEEAAEEAAPLSIANAG